MSNYNKLFLDNNIPVQKTEDEIKGFDGIILPVVIDNKRFYFKFLPKEFKMNIEREIKTVEELKKNNCNVPIYYKKDNKSIFEIDNQICYATLEVPGIQFNKNVNKDLLKPIITELAKMHRVLKNIPVLEEKESDLDRFHSFYEKNKIFFKKNGLEKYIESVLSKDYNNEDVIYIHADVNFRNIFVENEDIYFIDFTDLRVGYIEDDLGKLFQNILYLNLSDEELNELIKIYEQELGNKINNDNLVLSIVFRIMYRYFCFVNNCEGNINEYKNQTEKILKKYIGGV